MRFPFYVPTKGRHEYMVTSKALTTMGIKHFVIVEAQELGAYNLAIKRFKLLAQALVLPPRYKEEYELCDNLGLSASTGPGPARNFAWDHSKDHGFGHHWVMDDNIKGFFRLNKNLKVPCRSSSCFTAMEDFVLRYKNVAMSGPTYFYFILRKTKYKPFATNTRIYSCNFIRNNVPFRWRGRYNEDTILSLDMLKAGWCTIQFNAFMQDKMATQELKGGNTGEFYHKEGKVVKKGEYATGGTDAKSKMLVDVHPDVSKLSWKFSRVHHHVDYSQFKKHKLIRSEGVEVPTGVNNYGMGLKKVKNG